MQESFYESGNCVQIICAIEGVHPTTGGPGWEHLQHPRAKMPFKSNLGEAPVLHQSIFKPNWTCRDVVEVLVITPAVGETPEGVKTTALGWLKLARFRRLKISERN